MHGNPDERQLKKHITSGLEHPDTAAVFYTTSRLQE